MKWASVLALYENGCYAKANLDSKTVFNIDIISGRFSLSLYVGNITLYFIVTDPQLNLMDDPLIWGNFMEDQAKCPMSCERVTIVYAPT